MKITLGDKIKINGEEVPEYLLNALYENLKQKFEVSHIARSIVTSERIASNASYAHKFNYAQNKSNITDDETGKFHTSCNCITANKIQANGLHINPSLIREL